MFYIQYVNKDLNNTKRNSFRGEESTVNQAVNLLGKHKWSKINSGRLSLNYKLKYSTLSYFSI